MTALLEARHVTKVFGQGFMSNNQKSATVALHEFTLGVEVDPPSITAIVGESGSGKTTLARTLLGLAEPTRGEVLYRGTDLRLLSKAQRQTFLREIQVIFQDPFEVYNPFYRVDHVLETPIRKLKLASTKQQTRQLIEETLRAVGLRPDETLGRYPHQLSGGQRQRIMVARAVLVRPRLIIADEPVSMVDASLRATILDSLRELKENFGISLIYITHDLTTAYQISDNIVVLYRGSAVEAGEVGHVVKDPQHPYTQLLVGSIPQPDPEHAWQRDVVTRDPGDTPTAALSGCMFADRCPYVMDVCVKQPPPLFQTQARRAAACFRYDHAPVLKSSDLGEVLVTSTAANGAHAGSASPLPNNADGS
jgi:peptide/nickel transport system ATP-binding protein